MEKNTQIKQTDKENRDISLSEYKKKIVGTGTNISNGYIMDEYSSKFYGTAKYDIYDQMYNDSTVYRGMHAIDLMARLGQYDIEPFMDDDGNISNQSYKVAEFVKKALFKKMNITRNQFIKMIKRKRKDGNSVFEVGMREDEEGVRPVLIYRKAKNIEKYEMDNGEAGIVFGAWGINGNTYENLNIPANKLLMFIYDQEGENYEGQSLFRRIARDRQAKSDLQKFQVIRQERLAVPIVEVKVSSTATQDKIDEAIESAKNIRTYEEGVVMGVYDEKGNPIISFEFMDNKTGGSDTKISDDIAQYEQNILDGFYASFLYLGKSATGSYNQGKSDNDFFMKGVEVDTNEDMDIVNKYLIPLIVDFNFNNIKGYPTVKLNNLAKQDMSVFSQTVSNFSSAGMITPTFDTENKIREMINIPELTEEEKERYKEEQNKKNQTKVKDKPTNSKKIEDKTEDKDEDEDEDEDKEFHEFKDIINNNKIIEIQNCCSSAKEFAELKKKGFKFNDYEKISPRPLTFAERKVNLMSLKEKMTLAEDKIKKLVDQYGKDQINHIFPQVTKSIIENKVQKLEEITTNKLADRKLALDLASIQQDMFELGRTTVSTEIKVEAGKILQETKDFMKQQNIDLVNQESQKIVNIAKATTNEQIAKKGGLISGLSPSETTVAVDSAITRRLKKTLSAMMTPYVGGTVNMGRASIAEIHPETISAVQYSAILDNRTTNRCLSLDGRVVKLGSSEYYNYSPPQHPNCRSIWVYIDKDEKFQPKITGIPKSIPVKTDIYQEVDMKNPIVLKNSPASKLIKEQQI